MATGIEQYLAQGMAPNLGQAYASGIAARQQRRARELNYTQSLEKYQEWRADAETRRKTRRKNEKTLDFQLANLDDRLGEQRQAERIASTQLQEGEIAREVEQINFDDPKSYNESMTKLNDLGVLPEELVGPDGTFADPKEAKPLLEKRANAAIDTVQHRQALELAQIRAQNSLPSWAATEPSIPRRTAAYDEIENFTKGGVVGPDGDPVSLDLGKMTETGSDSRYLSNALASTVNMVARRNADMGQPTNEPLLHQQILEIAKRHIYTKDGVSLTAAIEKDDLPYNLPFRKEWTVDRAGFASDISQIFGLGDTGLNILSARDAQSSEKKEGPRERADERRAGGKLPPKALKALQGAGGRPVTFSNGQTWVMQNGEPQRVDQQ